MNPTAKITVGPYEVTEELGTGTVSQALLARSADGKQAVVKRLHDALAQDPGVVQRFLGAGDLSSRIKNRRFLAAVVMQKSFGPGVFVVREYVPGRSLAEVFRAGDWAALDIKQLAADLCDALRALHQQKVVHGGLHPGNILVQPDGRCKLADFGISHAVLTGKVSADCPPGALRYLAPEQWRGQEAQPQTDLYALALVVGAVLARRELIAGERPADIQANALVGCRVRCPALASALQLEPARRPADVEALRKELLKWLSSSGIGDEEIIDTARGTLTALTAVRDKADVLALNHGQPWVLPRQGGHEQHPLILANGGPGALRVQVVCRGAGVRLTPSNRLVIPPGRQRYVIVELEAGGADFARLAFRWEGQRPQERVDLWIYRPTSVRA